ncbi:E-selectin-like [Haliotis cracherodii]|uniref:E-selectin-like n=1 Tax=Haliotis cracherodii TaxID=6455 RepID=UPI0039EA2B07
MFGSPPSDSSVMFATMIVNNFHQCFRLCVVTGGCQARKYDAEFRECHLYTAPEQITTRVPDGDNLSQEDTADKVSPSPCRVRPCRKDQICVVAASGDGHVCLSGSDCDQTPLRPTLVMTETGWNESHLGAWSVYTCELGHNKTGGSGVTVCQDSGQWSPPTLQCTAVDCGIPAARNNTEPSVQMTTTFNTTVTFTCSAGYRNHGGDDTITCQANGQWSSTSLDCQAVDCGIPAARNNTEPSVQMTTTFNTTVTFTCSAGYRNHGGDDTITCQANGQWSSTSLDCQVIRNWITTKTLSAGPAKLTCTDRMSPAGSLMSVSCEVDEMLIGCSSKSASSSGKNNGVKIVMVKDTPFCQIDTTSTTGASAQYASARCCKQEGLHCEYLTDGPSRNINDAHVQSECFKSFQVMGCGVHQPNGYLDGVEINPSYCRAYAGAFSVTGVYSYATCCRAPGLSCSVHSAKPQPVSGLLKATCPYGFTLTGCGGRNPWKEARGSYIADDGGTPTCHVESKTDRPDRTTVFYVCC